MTEIITELIRRKSGLYDLKITMPDGRVLVDVRGIRKTRAHGMIDEAEQKVDSTETVR